MKTVMKKLLPFEEDIPRSVSNTVLLKLVCMYENADSDSAGLGWGLIVHL